jgi:hypothetical protein
MYPGQPDILGRKEMKIAILSDTHIRYGRKLPSFVWNVLSEVDTIIHAGDVVTKSLIEELDLIAPVIAVRGNCDWLLDELPDKIIAKLGPLRIGVTHGYLGSGKNTPERAYHFFSGEDVDMIIFGHSHIPYKNVYEGVLLFNPGSPTERRGQPQFSMGLLKLSEKGSFDIQHLFF